MSSSFFCSRKKEKGTKIKNAHSLVFFIIYLFISGLCLIIYLFLSIFYLVHASSSFCSRKKEKEKEKEKKDEAEEKGKRKK